MSVEREPGLGTWGVVTFEDWRGEAPAARHPAIGPSAAQVAARPGAPTDLASVGDRFTVAGEEFVVASGSTLVLPPLPRDGSNGEVLLAVTGDPDAVFGAYAEQVRDNLDAEHGPATSDDGSPRFEVRRERLGRWRVQMILGNDGLPDGRSESVELMTRGGESYVRIVVTNG